MPFNAVKTDEIRPIDEGKGFFATHVQMWLPNLDTWKEKTEGQKSEQYLHLDSFND
jgi:hypothetical protein